MTSPNEIIAMIDARLPEALTLTVGRMVDDTIEAHHLALDDKAANGLREQCHIARDRISDGAPASYTATAELDMGEFFVIDDDQTLAELSAFRSLADNLGAIPQVRPSELDLTIKLYAVSLGNDSDRILFVRRTNPRLPHKAGGFLAIAQERLTRIEEPVFTFLPSFDFVLGPNWAVVLDQKSFEMLFRQIGLVEQHVSTWIKGITDHLPMSDSSIDSLREVALRDSRTWRRCGTSNVGATSRTSRWIRSANTPVRSGSTRRRSSSMGNSCSILPNGSAFSICSTKTSTRARLRAKRSSHSANPR